MDTQPVLPEIPPEPEVKAKPGLFGKVRAAVPFLFGIVFLVCLVLYLVCSGLFLEGKYAPPKNHRPVALEGSNTVQSKGRFKAARRRSRIKMSSRATD